tara:strand:+ start:42 stop:518 length:477 start_codon:yes stop_codon:yes gene_type:complete
MDFPTIDENENFAKFCQKANLPITELPTKANPMGMTYELAMREIDPYLYERLCDKKPLRADVAVRHQKGGYWIEDVEELEAKGYTGVAMNLKKQIAEGQEIIRQKELEKITARNAERDRKLAEYQKLDPIAKLAMHQPSPEAIAQARKEWGITGEPIF